MKVFELESRLQPHLYRMRKRGVRFNLEGSQELGLLWSTELEQLTLELEGVDIWSGRSIEAVAMKRGLGDFERTPTGEPSFTSQFFESTDIEFFKTIKRARKLDKGLQFVRGLTEKYNERTKRIHAQIHQLRSDDYGTVSGRFSYSHPNLQQIPTRDPEIGKPLRNLFLPEAGESWIGADYSSQESRILMHYVVKRGLGEGHPLVVAYQQDPGADFHQLVAEQLGVSRFLAKTINLGMTYGMGKAKLAAQLGLSMAEAELKLNDYHNTFPFVRQIKKMCEDMASKHGVIATLSGRRCRFEKYEPYNVRGVTALPHDEALKKWPRQNIRRAYTYKALNRLIQGSAADQNKMALLAACEAGVDVKISIHDEITASGDEGTMATLMKCMEEAVELNVPTPVDAAMGSTWGETK
jgi:DNA polymerase I-like protein with 3'-5' exonuclease and polymerase domains